MALLCDHRWKTKYTPDDGDLVDQFYVQALDSALRYDRTTGFFAASALTLAARGIESLVRNNGRMRLLIGCTLEEPETSAIRRGESLREVAGAAMLRMPLLAPGATEAEALELLAWMVAKGFLDVKVAVPCDAKRHPIAGFAIFHEKAGVIEDKTGDRVAFAGSINETARGWKDNWESFHVFCSWSGGEKHVAAEEESFARLWADKSPRALVVDVPTAVRDELLKFLPANDQLPARLAQVPELAAEAAEEAREVDAARAARTDGLRRAVWAFIWGAPTQPWGVRVGEATSAVTPWPHQVRAFERMWKPWPPKLLIADEVGLGKTIEAGLVLRQAWLSGRAKRILVLAPKAVLSQWQRELREKFNLDWPIYDGDALSWQPTPVHPDGIERTVARDAWQSEPFVLASSQLMRRRERQSELLDASIEPWDIVVLDEAHHARRRNSGQPGEGGPNLLLRLMQGLRRRTQGLILLTATPMQVHPLEVYDLLALLDLPDEWTATAFQEFFRLAAKSDPTPEEFDRLSKLFQSVERSFGTTPTEDATRVAPNRSVLRGKRILRALRDSSSIPRRQLDADDRKSALALMRANTPVARLVSRHTRDLLRAYHRLGRLATPIATRQVEDTFLRMSDAEAAVYVAVEDYISTTYNNAAQDERSSVGFVMTIYRRRLASSFYALRRTLEDRLAALHGDAARLFAPERLDEDADAGDEEGDTDPDDALAMERRALDFEERGRIKDLLAMVATLPTDTKARHLRDTLAGLQDRGYAQAIVFTQYTDTLEFLREYLRETGLRILCFSGRGGEFLQRDGNWRAISRDETKRRFRAGDANVLLCTDAAAEGLNFQFCGALINFDSPWNPMRIEQRIGRVDRLGQGFPEIAIVNLMYEDTVETDVYRALRQRIGLFTAVVGKLQPILSTLPSRIAAAALANADQRAQTRAALVPDLTRAITAAEAEPFDLDDATRVALEEVPRASSPYDLADLWRLLARPELLPSSTVTKVVSVKEAFLDGARSATTLRVTTDPDYFEQHADSVELWSPGSPAFGARHVSLSAGEAMHETRSLAELIDAESPIA